MNNEIVIGIDVGGSHITSAAVDIKKLSILPRTTNTIRVDNKTEKDIILKKWAEAINKTIKSASLKQNINIGIAIPGPFDYKKGIGLFEGGNDKFENLYNVSIPQELSKFIDCEKINFRFLNDATSFGVGAAAQGKAKHCNKLIVVTLGTGFGSAFIMGGVPLVTHELVPNDGCLWDKKFKDGIADDYFSTRWCINRYEELSSIKVKGVKEIAEANTIESKLVFEEFGSNMADFMTPYLKKYRPELIVMGGNIAKAGQFFIPTLQQQLAQVDVNIDIEISSLMEDAAIIGSAKLFDSIFWNQIQK